MELQEMSCCGLFELTGLSDLDEDREFWNSETGQYDYKTIPTGERFAECKRMIRGELGGIEPKGRVVFATTIPSMRLAARALRALRFTVCKRFRNGNSGNQVTVWMKHVRR